MSYGEKQSRESGAILGFIVVLIVLAALLAGGLWFIKHRADVAASVDTVSQKASDTAKKAENKPADNTKKDDTKQQSGTQSQPSPSNSGSAPSNTTQPSNQAQSGSSAQPSATETPSGVAATGPTHIASTGPADVLMNAYLLGALVIVGYFYQQSRKVSR